MVTRTRTRKNVSRKVVGRHFPRFPNRRVLLYSAPPFGNLRNANQQRSGRDMLENQRHGGSGDDVSGRGQARLRLHSSAV